MKDESRNQNVDPCCGNRTTAESFAAGSDLQPKRLWELLQQVTTEKMMGNAELRAVMQGVYRETRERWERERGRE